MNKTKGKEIIKVAMAAVLSIGLCSAAFVGANHFAFAAATSKTESIPPIAAVHIPAARVVAPEDYRQPELFVYDATDRTTAVNPNALSAEEAAELGARYIWDMFGESMDGKTVKMTYCVWPSHTRAYWLGEVADSKDAAENHDILYDFYICAVSGERIDISRFSLGLAEESGPEVKEALAALMNDSSRRDEAIRVRSGGEPPAQLDEYAQAAEDFAAIHFVGTEVVSVAFRNTAVGGFDFDENGNLIMNGQRLLFEVIDSTGRKAYVAISTETKELISIETQHNDVIPGYHYEAPGVG